LFNIGAEGQFIIGATAAALTGYFLQLPAFIHIPTVIVAAIVAAGLWGGFAGILKARFGINEVISTIMLNWIAFYLHNYIIMNPIFRKPNTETSFSIHDTASLVVLEEWKSTPDGIAYLSNIPLLKDLLRTPLNYGIVIAIIAAVIVWFILNKTTLGYKLQAVGYNKFAAEYGGINVNTKMVTSMTIAGALAGLAGATHVMGVSKNITLLAGMEGYGFDGIAVSLIGGNTAAGTVLSGLLFGAIKYGGTKIQPNMQAPSEIISIVIGTIIFFLAITRFVKIIMKKIQNKRSLKNV
jgi:simple sugar transport system permease protein